MNAITLDAYGAPQVLTVNQVAQPLVKEDQVLVRIVASAVNSGDIRIRKANPWAVRLIYGLRPSGLVLGSVFSGEVVATGEKVTRFRKGDEVFGSTGTKLGTYAEFISLPEDSVMAIKPARINHVEASVIPFGGATALYFLKKANIIAGQRVLVYGASGAVGSAAVQLARSLGARVTAVCGPGNVELMKALGADEVIDYTVYDFRASSEVYDVVFETISKLPYSLGIKLTRKGGTIILGSAGASDMFRGLWTSLTGGKKVIFGVVKPTQADMAFLSSLVSENKLIPVIDRTYPFEQVVEAHAYVEQGHKRGNVALIFSA